jgi:CheY-like chemotaxis protein
MNTASSNPNGLSIDAARVQTTPRLRILLVEDDAELIELLRTSLRSVAPDVELTVADEALRLGAEDWLVKPFGDPEIVVRALRYAVERKRLKEELIRLQKLEAVGR